jgi:general secretion pathway protein G
MINQEARRERLSGWTFVEAIAVLAIMLVLSSVVAVSASRGIGMARRAAAQMEVQALALALHAYLSDTGDYPTEAQGLDALFVKPALAPVPQAWNGPYLDSRVSADPWGARYRYRRPGPDGLAFEILSLGADGRPDGTGDNADISSARTR